MTRTHRIDFTCPVEGSSTSTFDPSGGAPSTIVTTGVFPIAHLPGGGTIVQAGRIVEDLTTGSIVFERGNLETEGDVSAFCEALS